MNFKRLFEIRNPRILCDLWNNEYGKTFPITEELLNRNLSNAYDNASYVALDNEKVIGFIIGKIWESKFYIDSYNDTGWISLIYVHPEYRNKGIGTKLLDIVEKEFEKLNKKTIHIGKDYNDFFPGLPKDLGESLGWFEKRGYIRPYDTNDLINSNKDKIKLINNTFVFKNADLSDKDRILNFMRKNWPGRWTKETIDYFENGGTGREYLICLDGEQVIAFVKVGYPNTSELLISNSQTWRAHFKALGGIGPLGVDKEYRGRHLGYDIVASAKNFLIDAEASDIIIDWTGLIDFYKKFGFEIWKSYHYLTKQKGEKKDET